MKKKIKQIVKIILTKKPSKKGFFENNLVSNELIKEFHQINDYNYEAVFYDNSKVIIRNHNFSDYAVFKQIFNEKEYHSILKILQLNQNFKGKKVIVDAGANVGYTSVYFLQNLTDISILAVEPSQSNAEIFIQNTNAFNKNGIVRLYNNALCEVKNKSFEIDRDFRDGRDWSIATKEVANGTIKGITISEIIEQNNLDYISLLKIDIEGAERFIFNDGIDLLFLKITQVIAIEIHDEFNIRDTICSLLIQHNFFLFESGELTIGINKSML